MPPRSKTPQPDELEATPPDENRDAAILVGGPGHEVPPTEETAPAAPSVREIVLYGRKFAVDPELAQTLEKREKDFDRKLNEHSAELGNLRRELQNRPIPQPPPGPTRPNYDTLLFEAPTRAVDMIIDEALQKGEARLNQREAERDQQRQAREGVDKFWRDFYRKNKDIDPDEDGLIAESLLNKNLQRLLPLAPEDAIVELGDMTRRQILQYQQRAKLDDNDTQPTAPRTRVESASRPSPRTAPVENEGPATLSDAIKARRAARSRGRAA